MAWTDKPTLVCDGNAAVAIVSAGIGCAVRYDRQWSWLCWPSADGVVVARASGGPARPRELVECVGLPFELAKSPAAEHRIAALTTPSWWQFPPSVELSVRVEHPDTERPILVQAGALTLIAAHRAADPTSEKTVGDPAFENSMAAIRSGERPVVLALDASRPGQSNELAFVLDGHYILAAYRALGLDPTVRLLDCIPRSERWCWHPNGRPRRRYTADSDEYRTSVAIASRFIEQTEELRHHSPDELVPTPDGHELPCGCAAGDWSECHTDDPLEFGPADLDAALRDQPHTARRARPLYASVCEPELTWPGELVDISEGAGVIRVLGSRANPEASVLWFRGKPAFAEAFVARGTYLRLVARLAPEHRPSGFDDLIDWLADPVIERDYSGKPFVTRELLDRLRPLFTLFEPGQYEVRIEEHWSRLGLGIFTNEHLHPWPWPPGTGDLQFGSSGDFFPTDTWPPPDLDRIEWYRTRIQSGAEPVAVLVAPGPAGPEYPHTRMSYLLDGHHKVAAGARLFIEIAPCHDDDVTNEGFAALLEPHLGTPPFWDDSSWPGVPDLIGMSYGYDRRGSVLSAAEYYARFDVRYGNPAAPQSHRTAADSILNEVADRLGDMALAELREIIDAPASFVSLLLDSLRGASLTTAEFAAIADLVDDIDDPRLIALDPDQVAGVKRR
ncbi:hypothetical protein OH799_35270 [Nocardia sp. NBC_00881]|uniref:hypothetical protein n=1 Tax=Nocardia sp. NBC_00881 TaxID=2975995 RepID=UPI00386668BA|nr:hypothetical protein OH799_35270 [Nocardia sp. NBC_00881]